MCKGRGVGRWSENSKFSRTKQDCILDCNARFSSCVSSLAHSFTSWFYQCSCNTTATLQCNATLTYILKSNIYNIDIVRKCCTYNVARTSMPLWNSLGFKLFFSRLSLPHSPAIIGKSCPCQRVTQRLSSSIRNMLDFVLFLNKLLEVYQFPVASKVLQYCTSFPEDPIVFCGSRKRFAGWHLSRLLSFVNSLQLF